MDAVGTAALHAAAAAAAFKAGSAYLMCENRVDGLARLNGLREKAGLPAISKRWHNRFLLDEKNVGSEGGNLTLEACERFISTYYPLSRVANAWLALQEGRDPQYDARMNRMAPKLPVIEYVGQSRFFVWGRCAEGGQA